MWEVACSSEKPEWAHDTAKNGGQRREWHLGRSWWSLPWHVGLLGSRALTRRSSPTEPAKLNDAKKSIYDETQSAAYSAPLTLLRFGWGFQGALGPVKCYVIRNECHDMKGKIVGHYGRPQLTSSTSRRLETNLISRYHFSRRGQYPIRDANL